MTRKGSPHKGRTQKTDKHKARFLSSKAKIPFEKDSQSFSKGTSILSEQNSSPFPGKLQSFPNQTVTPSGKEFGIHLSKILTPLQCIGNFTAVYWKKQRYAPQPRSAILFPYPIINNRRQPPQQASHQAPSAGYDKASFSLKNRHVNLTDDPLQRHHPEKAIAFRHRRIDKAGTDIRYHNRSPRATRLLA